MKFVPNRGTAPALPIALGTVATIATLPQKSAALE